MAFIDVLKKIKEIVDEVWAHDGDASPRKKSKKKSIKKKRPKKSLIENKMALEAEEDTKHNNVDLQKPAHKSGAGITSELPPPPNTFANRFAKGDSPRNLVAKEKGGAAKILENKPDPAASQRFADKSGLRGGGAPTSENVAKDPSLVYLVRGKDKGREAWHYVLVKRNLLPIFLKHTQGGTVDVAKFGTILFSGWGKDPPPEIVAKIDNGEY